MTLYEILPGQLYQRGSLDRWRPGDRIQLLQTHRITWVVALWGVYDRFIALSVASYIYHPIADGKTVDVAPLHAIARRVADAMRQGQRALVTCHAGRNRSGFLNALILHQYAGLSGDEALAWVRRGRPRAVANPAFEAYLTHLPPLRQPLVVA